VESLVISPVGSIAVVARMVLGVIFLLSGYNKLRDLDGLSFGILRYQILPPRFAWSWARPLAYLLTFTELGLSVLLLTGTLVYGAAVASVVLLACFAWAVGAQPPPWPADPLQLPDHIARGADRADDHGSVGGDGRSGPVRRSGRAA
jgi:uncharacterized membrane protein YphA (DoxX/SURF4 family)